MKRIISILLVAMLLIGMFPATALTAFAAETTTYTFSGYTAGTQYAENEEHTLDDVVTVVTTQCHFTTQLRIYSSSTHDGYAIIKSTKQITQFAMNAGNKTDTVNVYGSNDEGATWTLIEGIAVTATSYKDYTSSDFTATPYSWLKLDVAGSSQVRLASMTLTFAEGTTEPEEPACEHANTELQDKADASCTTDGYTGDEICLDCGETIEEGEVIPAGHNYVDGTCSVCGEAEPAGYVEADVSTLSNTDQVIVTMTKGTTVYALTNGNGTSKAPAATVVTVTDNTIAADDVTDALIWNVVYSGGNIEIYPNGTTDTWLYCTSTNNGVRVGTNANKVFTVDASSGYLKNTATSRYLGVYTTTPDWRCYTNTTGNTAGQTLKFYKLSNTAAESCEHVNTEIIPAVAATCASTGLTEGLKCSDCGEIQTAQEPTPVREHNMVDGICAYADCGLYEHQAELMTGLPGNGDKVIIHHISSNNALGLAVKNDDLVGISTTPAENKLSYYTSVALLTVGIADGGYTLAADGKYLTTDANNTLYFAENLTDNGLWSITLTDGSFLFENVNATNDSSEALALEYYGGAFTTYKTGTGDYYLMNLYLVEKGACTCTNTQEQSDGYAATCTEPGMTNSVKCLDCGATVTAQQEIPALGHNYVDGFCTNDGCGIEQVIANYVLVSSLDEITDGQYVIVANVDGVYYAMNNAIESGKFTTVAVEVSKNTVTTADAPVWTIAASEGNVTLQAEAGYLNYNSGTSFKFADTAYTWSVAAGETAGTFILNSTEETRGIYYQIGNKFGAYANSNATNKDYCAYLQLYKYVQPVVAADGTGYNTIEKAIAAGENNLKLYADVNSDITFDGNLYLDLNGFSVDSLTVTNGTLYASDSKATTAAASGAEISALTGTVEVDNTVDGKRYIALNIDGAYSFHVLEMKVTAISLRTTAAGVYYKAKIICDEQLSGATQSYGMLLSISNMPGADFQNDGTDVNKCTVKEGNPTSNEAFTSGSIFGIFKDTYAADINRQRGEIAIYANAYLKLNDANGGKILVADTTTGDKTSDADFDGIAWSLQKVMQTLDASTSLTAEQQTRIRDFYDTWGIKDFGWNLANIATWTPSAS